METKYMQLRSIKLAKILMKIAVMGLVMAGIILINRSYMKSADGSEKRVSQNITCHSEFFSESYNSIS